MRKLMLCVLLALVGGVGFAQRRSESSGDYEVLGDTLVKYRGAETHVVIPGNLGIRKIADAFKGSDIVSVNIPYGVISIGDDAFLGCLSLTSASIPESVTSIGEYAFSQCAIKSIAIPNSVTSIGVGAFLLCSLTSITIPNSVTTISRSAFTFCRDLTSVSIPGSVTGIDDYAFVECAVATITIPSSVASIGQRAFGDCRNLISVRLSRHTKYWNDTFPPSVVITYSD